MAVSQVYRTRQKEWIEQNGPCTCGSTQYLLVVWAGEGKSPFGLSKIWGYSEPKRLAMLAGCRVECYQCYHDRRWPPREHGTGVQGIRNCKCEPCMKRNREYSQRRKQMNKERLARIAQLAKMSQASG